MFSTEVRPISLPDASWIRLLLRKTWGWGWGEGATSPKITINKDQCLQLTSCRIWWAIVRRFSCAEKNDRIMCRLFIVCQMTRQMLIDLEDEQILRWIFRLIDQCHLYVIWHSKRFHFCSEHWKKSDISIETEIYPLNIFIHLDEQQWNQEFLRLMADGWSCHSSSSYVRPIALDYWINGFVIVNVWHRIQSDSFSNCEGENWVSHGQRIFLMLELIFRVNESMNSMTTIKKSTRNISSTLTSSTETIQDARRRRRTVKIDEWQLQTSRMGHKYREQLLLQQLKKHKQFLISPVVLVLLSLPRLIISLVSECVDVSSHSWLSLSGYFISLIPCGFVQAIVPRFNPTLATTNSSIINFYLRLLSRFYLQLLVFYYYSARYVSHLLI